MNTRQTTRALLGAAALLATGLSQQAFAIEPLGGGAATPGGLTVGPGAGAPPPGVYSFDQVFTIDTHNVGPGAAPGAPYGAADVYAKGIIFVPGWTFLGGTYDAVIVQPFVNADALGSWGVHNTFLVPGELSWKLGGGFSVLLGMDLYVPDGDTASGIGSPYWTFSPNLKVSYLNDGWNLTANLFPEINTKNTITGYTTGTLMHGDFTFTKTIGKWTIGPVAYYLGQISNDTSSATYGGLVGAQRWSVVGVGGLIGYDFGPASLSVYAFDDVYAHASGATFGAAPGTDSATIGQGWRAFATLSYRLWGPDAPADHSRVPNMVTK